MKARISIIAVSAATGQNTFSDFRCPSRKIPISTINGVVADATKYENGRKAPMPMNSTHWV